MIQFISVTFPNVFTPAKTKMQDLKSPASWFIRFGCLNFALALALAYRLQPPT